MRASNPAASAAIHLIELYQRHLSPRKGYRCAYSVLHGGTGCSGYAKHAIAEHGIFNAYPLIMQRFSDCTDAAKHFRTDLDCGCAADALPGNCDLPDRQPCGNRSAGNLVSCLDVFSCSGSGDEKRKAKRKSSREEKKEGEA